MERETRIITTGDGSHSLYLPQLNETYHSSHGALTESEHVFIKAGLDHYLEKQAVESIYILEIGFGTGLNAFLAWDWARQNKVVVHFTSLEPFPLTEEIYTQLNYTENREPWAIEAFQKLHWAGWDETLAMDECVHLQKAKTRLEDFVSEQRFQLVFFDAFAPQKQGEMWEVSMLEKCFHFLKPQGVLTTYCAQGQFKRNLRSIGFEVFRVDGPPNGKREMTRAIRN